MLAKTTAASRAFAILDGKMRRVSGKHQERDCLESELNARLDAVKGLYAPRIAALGGLIARLREDIEAFCRAERNALTNGAAKSLSTPYGKVGFRNTAGQLVWNDGLDAEAVCRELRRRDLGCLIRVSEEPDKLAIRRALESGEVNAETLAQCGVRVKDAEERFFCTVNQANDRGDS